MSFLFSLLGGSLIDQCWKATKQIFVKSDVWECINAESELRTPHTGTLTLLSFDYVSVCLSVCLCGVINIDFSPLEMVSHIILDRYLDSQLRNKLFPLDKLVALWLFTSFPFPKYNQELDNLAAEFNEFVCFVELQFSSLWWRGVLSSQHGKN